MQLLSGSAAHLGGNSLGGDGGSPCLPRVPRPQEQGNLKGRSAGSRLPKAAHTAGKGALSIRGERRKREMRSEEMRSMEKSARSFAAITVALVFTSSLAQARIPDATEANRSFMNEAIRGDLAEIKIGKLAQRKGASEKVRLFGKTLERDHSANLKKAASLAESLGAKLPDAPSASEMATYDKLSSLSGIQFDRRFAKKMVQDHKKDIQAFQRASMTSGPAAGFARRTLPTLQEHLKIAKSLGGSKT